jgi:hypothetical protein
MDQILGQKHKKIPFQLTDLQSDLRPDTKSMTHKRKKIIGNYQN